MEFGGPEEAGSSQFFSSEVFSDLIFRLQYGMVGLSASPFSDGSKLDN
jgi:hypothetical protein